MHATVPTPANEGLRRAVDLFKTHRDQPRFTQALSQVQGEGTTTSGSPPGGASLRSAGELWRRLRLWDSLLSLVVLVFTALVYAVTAFNDTWGSPADLGLPSRRASRARSQ